MSDNEKRTKPKYEAPIIVPLGELARGAGACDPGSSDVTTCTQFGGAALATCTNGASAAVTCTDTGAAVI